MLFSAPLSLCAPVASIHNGRLAAFHVRGRASSVPILHGTEEAFSRGAVFQRVRPEMQRAPSYPFTRLAMYILECRAQGSLAERGDRRRRYCREQFRRIRSFAEVVDVMKETETRAKQIRRKRGSNATLRRNKRASAAELRGMHVAFLEVSGDHAAVNDVICLPIRQPTAPCRNCPHHKCKIQQLELRIKDLESRNVIEMAAQKFVDEARCNVKDIEWPSARRKLLLLFHPDKLNLL